MGVARQSAPVRHELLERLQEARERSDEVFRLVRGDALYDRPIPERHRIVFYIGHLEAFDWNLLSERVIGEPSIHPEFDRLFAFGIDPVGGGLPVDQPSDWPQGVKCKLTCAKRAVFLTEDWTRSSSWV